MILVIHSIVFFHLFTFYHCQHTYNQTRALWVTRSTNNQELRRECLKMSGYAVLLMYLET